MIDTAKLRERVEVLADRFGPGWTSELLQLCDELDQARADVLKIRAVIDGLDGVLEGKWIREIQEILDDTAHYEQFREGR